MIRVMRKIFALLMTVALFAACSSDDVASDTEAGSQKSTEVYAMGKQLGGVDATVGTRAGDAGQWTDAYFFIRIDGRIPKKVGQYKSNEYWPYNGGSVFKNENKGLVDTSYPYWKIYSSDGYSSTREYLYDSTGDAVSKIIDKVPSFEDMMSVNMKDRDDVNAILDSMKTGKYKLKIIWYVAKFTYGKWHVDGVLTFEDVDDVTEIPGGDYGEPSLDNKAEEASWDGTGNIEVDIHQQEHQDWQEIKTSVHVRDLVKNVKIEIPLEYENVAEADDFAIRTFDLELDSKVFINGTEYTLDSTNPVKVTIEHQTDKVVFTIVCTDAKYLEALRKEYGDGVTIEIHTYPKNLTKETVWGKLKNAKVTVSPSTYENLVFKGATSAFFTE